jgi:hypothetical protein
MSTQQKDNTSKQPYSQHLAKPDKTAMKKAKHGQQEEHGPQRLPPANMSRRHQYATQGLMKCRGQGLPRRHQYATLDVRPIFR